MFACRYINGDIYECTRNPKDLIDAMVEIHRTRWFKYVRKVVMDFQEFVQFLYLQVCKLLYTGNCLNV